MILSNEVNTMKAKWFFGVVFVLGVLLIAQGHTPYAQKTGKTFNLLYSNNINGEVDPCPT